jgi:electron transfer flavoprotein alpha subunit
MHVTAISREQDSIQISRWYYRQRMEAKLSREHRVWCIALESGCFEPWSGAPADQAVDTVACTLSPEILRTNVIGFESAASEIQTIRPDAKLLFVAGAGWTKKQQDGKVHSDLASSLILGFLEQSKASLGGSKSVVDLGSEGQAILPFMTHLNQIGQTGSTPRHQKGLSTCCHGEEPHVVGWRFITERRAINLDVNCSWAQGKCDVLYVADAFKVMERVNEILKQRTKQVTAVS